MAPKAIPRHEPEVIQAKVNRRHGDPEKVATTSIKRLIVKGVKAVSRYDKANEYELMQKMIEALPDPLVRKVQTIFCDSKANDSYTVTIYPWDRKEARRTAAKLDAAARKYNKGHNGIVVGYNGILDENERQVWIDPWWDENPWDVVE